MRWLRGTSWTSLLKRVYERAFAADVFSRSAQVAFYFSFAIFPLLYFLVSLFGMVLESSSDLKTELFSYLQQIMPFSVFELVRDTVEEIVANSTGGKLTIGLVATLWSASAGIDAVRTALNEIYQLKENRPWWRTKLQSLVMTLVFAVLTAAVLAAVLYGGRLLKDALNGAGYTLTSSAVLLTAEWISILLVMLFACEMIYNLLPAFGRFRWVWIMPGSLVAIALWIIFTTAFRTYLGYFNSYNRTYGSLGAVIIMMLWLYLTALALMIGGTINAAVHEIQEGDKPQEASA